MSEHEHEQERDRGFLEQHVQTILSGLVLAGIVWLAATSMETRENLAVALVKIDGLQTQMRDRFTGSEGRKLEKRVDDLERRLRDVER